CPPGIPPRCRRGPLPRRPAEGSETPCPTTIRDVEVWDGEVRTKVLVGGDGPPLLYLHAIMGLQWDPFVESLAAHHTVYAPYLPGTVPGDPDAHKAVEDVWDLTLCYSEILDALGLGGEPVAVVGHSFGGMLGAE